MFLAGEVEKCCNGRPALSRRMTQTALFPDDNPRYLPADLILAPPFMHVTVVAYPLCLFFLLSERNHKS